MMDFSHQRNPIETDAIRDRIFNIATLLSLNSACSLHTGQNDEHTRHPRHHPAKPLLVAYSRSYNIDPLPHAVWA